MDTQQENTINFTLHYGQIAIPIQTFKNEYHSLMSLISDKLQIPGFGLCCGMGSCGECRVQIKKINEKAGIFVQSCGTLINVELHNTDIFILSGY